MALGPRYRPGSSPANKQFTDREAFIDAFDRALEQLDPLDETTYQVLVYYGVGGIGKTALRQYFGRKLDTETDVRWAVVDFDAPTNRVPENALFVMRNELKRKYKFRFPTFDLAYALYWERTHPQTPLAKADIFGLDEGDLLVDLLLAIEDVPGLGLLTKIPKAVSKLGGKALDWWRGRQDDLRTLSGLEPQQMLERLSMFWALDLEQALDVTGERVVLFLDTYEALWEGKRVEHLRFSVDQWVRDWVLQLPQVLWVLGGREKMGWSELNPDWHEALDQHLVGALADEDARRFLRTAGIAETGIPEAIMRGAEGVPFYLDVAVDTYLQITRTGQAAMPADFAQTPREVLDRFLKYLDRSERETLNVLSAARTWDRALFERLITTFKTGYPPTALGDLCRFSFIEEVQTEGEVAQRKWTMHSLMREGLQTHSDPALITRVHRSLFEYYDAALQDLDPKALTETHRQALGEAFYHARQVLAPEDFIAWYRLTADAFQQAAQWRFLIPLQEQMTAFTEDRYGPEDIQTAQSLNSLAVLYSEQGKYGEAEPFFQRALSIREKVLGAAHPHVASSLVSLAGIYFHQGKYREAEPFFQRALSIREKVLGAAHPDVAQSLNNLAVLRWKQDKYGEAEPFFQRALSIREKVLGAAHPDVAQSLNNLAMLHWKQGKYGEAEPLYQRALSIYEKVLGAAHPDVATLLGNLAMLHWKQGKYGEAEPLYQRALSIYEKTLGEEHPDVALSLHNLALLYDNQGKYEEAEPLYQRALSIIEKAFGTNHPDVASVLSGLGGLYRNQGKYGEAEPLYQRALSIYEKTLGEEHPHTQIMQQNYMKCLEAQNREKGRAP